MAGKTVSILEGNTFVVSDQAGNIEASATDTGGLFAWDTRFLSQWVLTLDGVKPNVLSTDDLQYFSAQFFLVPGTGTVYVDAALSIIRKRAVGNGFHEDVIVLNHSDKPVDHELRLEAASDFADLFEVKDALAKKGQHYSQVEGEAVEELERTTLAADGVVLRYGTFYGPGTYHERPPLPAPPRVHVETAARRTVELLDAPSGIVEITD